MPFFKIETNQKLDPSTVDTLLEKCSKFISSMVGKPEPYVMVSIDHSQDMIFGGNTEPAAMVKLKSIGLPADKCNDYVSRISQFLNDEVGVPQDRVFIDVVDLQRNMFGWNGKTFG
jgi:phenylpyruvate tautomerase PptA (4-oxalocrotonate tautomerase family)